jgi:hypothetical protein
MVLLACTSLLAQPSGSTVPAAATSAEQMTTAARALLAALSPAELNSTLFALDASERSHWSNVPFQAHNRPGLRLGDLGREQTLRLHELLRASLSSQGYQKVVGVIRLDDINRAQQVGRLRADASAYAKAQAESFGSDNYFIAFFGDPRTDKRWGWLIQGHHLGVSFTVADGRAGFLPMFVGATPLAVEEDAETGWSALAQEVTRGVELVTSLSERQRAIAVAKTEVPGDVLNGVGNKQRFTDSEGLSASAMTPGQQRLLRALVEEYLRNADFDAADEQLAAISASGWDRLTFSWRGAIGNLDEPFYYRVQGPRLIIELRNTENHVHTIARDPANDYGEAWLGLMYRETITAAERSAAARRAGE